VLLLSSAQGPEKSYYYPSGKGLVEGCYYRLHKGQSRVIIIPLDRDHWRAIIIPLDRDHWRAVLNKTINLRTPSNSLSCEFVDIHDGVHEYPFYKTSQHPKENMVSQNIGKATD